MFEDVQCLSLHLENNIYYSDFNRISFSFSPFSLAVLAPDSGGENFSVVGESFFWMRWFGVLTMVVMLCIPDNGTFFIHQWDDIIYSHYFGQFGLSTRRWEFMDHTVTYYTRGGEMGMNSLLILDYSLVCVGPREHNSLTYTHFH